MIVQVVDKSQVKYKEVKTIGSSINNKEYNKFLKRAEGVALERVQQKVLKDANWSGLKAYITNSKDDHG
ncbi:MAG: hypothetical protein ACXITV_12915 [Luteibaculaceae bacterium]